VAFLPDNTLKRMGVINPGYGAHASLQKCKNAVLNMPWSAKKTRVYGMQRARRETRDLLLRYHQSSNRVECVRPARREARMQISFYVF